MSKAKNKALKIGGIALIIWLLLRKAGSSAPLPGDTYGGKGNQNNQGQQGQGNNAPVENWANNSGQVLKVYWNNPSGNLYGYLSANDIKSNRKDYTAGGSVGKKLTVKKGSFIGYVQYFDKNTFAQNIGLLKVLINGTESLRFYPFDFTKGATKNMVTVKPL